MEKVSVRDVDPVAIDADSDRRGLSAPPGATDVAVNHYRIAPGEGFAGGLHAHTDQEEIFVVEGEATFETLARKDSGETASDGTANAGEVTVGEGEAIRFAPGEFQSGRNESGDYLVALAIGAPRDTEDVRIPQSCPECGHGELRLEASRVGLALVCPDCGVEHVPQPCPECGHDDLRVALSDGDGTVVVCHDCDAEFESAPLRT